MKILAFLSLEAVVVYITDVLHTSGDPIIYLATVAASLTALWRFVIRPTRKAWGRVEDGIGKLAQLDPETLQALKSLPEWHEGFEMRMHAIEQLVKNR